MPVPPNFSGLRVAAFESRRASEMTELLQRAGAVASVSPSMREVPHSENPQVVDFAQRVIDGEFDVVIFMTGVGFRFLLGGLEGQINREQFLGALAKLITIARGPKPVAAMKEVGLQPTYRVPEPNTWRDILATIDERAVPLQGSRVAVQEYGLPNTDLRLALTERGASVMAVPVYRWEMPVDTGPLQRNLKEIVAGRIDVVLFTSSQQVVHVLQLSREMGIEEELRRRFQGIAVGSIGPTTSEILREQDLPVDLEPKHPKMGYLVKEVSGRSVELVQRKRSHMPQ